MNLSALRKVWVLCPLLALLPNQICARAQLKNAVTRTIKVQGSGWSDLTVRGPKTIEVKGSIHSSPIEVILGVPASGRLAFVGPYKSQQGNQLVSISQLGIVDLSNKPTDVFSGELFELHERISDFTSFAQPTFSPDGSQLMFGLAGDSSNSFPVFLNTQKNSFRGLSCQENYETLVPSSSGFSWAPDGKRVAYFPRVDGGEEELSELTLANQPIRLYTQNFDSQTRTLAAQSQGLVAPVSWLDKQSILFGALPPNKGKLFGLYDVSKPGQLPRPNIYSFDVTTGKSTLRIADGYRPTASPDGTKIAFFGSPDVKRPVPLYVETSSILWLWRYLCNGASLCVANADGSRRIAFQSYRGRYPRIQWLSDNRHFVTFNITKAGHNYEAEVDLWDCVTQEFKHLATLRAANVAYSRAEDPYDIISFPFTSRGTSSDGHLVFVSSESMPSSGKVDGSYDEVLQSIDVDSGQVATVATVKNSNGIDWKSN